MYEPRDIFCVDECGLFFKLKPDKCGGNTKMEGGGELSKDKVTVVIAVNSGDSGKLPPVVVGKPAKPRYFKNLS